MAAVFTSNHCDLQSWQYLSFIIEQIVHDHVIKADIVPRAGWLLVLFVGRVFLSVLDIFFVFIPVLEKHGSTLLIKSCVDCLRIYTMPGIYNKSCPVVRTARDIFLGVGAPDFRSLQLRGRVSERSHEVYTAALYSFDLLV